MANFITIEYLYNSGFTIDYKDYFIVIDYYKGHIVPPNDKTVVYIVTHNHPDHYNPAIFGEYGTENGYYVLSEDVEPVHRDGKRILLSDSIDRTQRLKRIYDRTHTRRVMPNQCFEFAGIRFETFGSTDRGVSIKFTVRGITFFHAGDLNAWKWPDFTPEQQQREVDDFVGILDEVRKTPTDIGFMVLDGRLGKNTFIGPDLYMNALRPQIIVPMHFREAADLTHEFAKRHGDRIGSKIQTINGPHELFVIQA